MQKKKLIEWRITERVLDPHVLYLSPAGHGGMTFTYAAAMYRIREVGYDSEGTTVDFRERYEVGKPLYAHEDGSAGVMMEALRPLMDTLRSMCWQQDEKQKTK